MSVWNLDVVGVLVWVYDASFVSCRRGGREARMLAHTYIHTYIHTHTHTYTHTYIHTYMHTYIREYNDRIYSIWSFHSIVRHSMSHLVISDLITSCPTVSVNVV